MSIENKDPQQSKALLDSGGHWTYVDVRTVEEFEQGHPPNAHNVPFAVRDPISQQMLPNPEFLAVMLANFPPDAKLVLGCAAGGRSLRACQALASEGFENLVNMDGGYLGRRNVDGQLVQPGWHALGYPIENETDPARTYAGLRAKA